MFGKFFATNLVCYFLLQPSTKCLPPLLTPFSLLHVSNLWLWLFVHCLTHHLQYQFLTWIYFLTTVSLHVSTSIGWSQIGTPVFEKNWNIDKNSTKRNVTHLSVRCMDHQSFHKVTNCNNWLQIIIGFFSNLF